MKTECWVRLGASIKVDPEKMQSNPVETLKEALDTGKIKLNGDTYFPSLSGNGILSEFDFSINEEIPIRRDNIDYGY